VTLTDSLPRIAEIGLLTSLQELILDENNLCDIQPVGELSNLKHLDINNNRLDMFPTEITRCLQLEILDGDGNDFEVLPDDIGNLKNLTRLNLNFVNLKYLPGTIGFCESLEEIKVHENYLQQLPNTIGLLRKLRVLVAHDNCLTYLPDELASCCSLTLLNVANNQLPDNIGHLKQIRSLNLIGNFLMYLPLSLGNADTLTGLQLSAFQTGMKKPKLSQVEYTDVGIVLTSPLLAQNYQPSPQKSPRQSNKIQFNVKSPSDEDTNKDSGEGKSSKDHPQITRIPTPTQKERRKLEKSARTISAEQQRKNDLPKPFEIKEAKVASTAIGTSHSYSNTPRQRRSIDPEYIELNSSDFRPLTRPSEPPPYNFARQYSKMSQAELENFHQPDNQNSPASSLLRDGQSK
jgi:erbb2-interacting protein